MPVSDFWEGSRLKGYLNKKGFLIKKENKEIVKGDPPTQILISKLKNKQKEQEDGGEK